MNKDEISGLISIIFLLFAVCFPLWMIWDHRRLRRKWHSRDIAHFKWVRAMNRDMISKGIEIEEYEGIPAEIAAELKIEEVTK